MSVLKYFVPNSLYYFYFYMIGISHFIYSSYKCKGVINTSFKRFKVLYIILNILYSILKYLF